MVRRDLVLVGALAAAVAGGAIGGVLLVGHGERAGRLPDAARAAAASGATAGSAEPTATPALAPVPFEDRADDPKPADDVPASGARREIEGAEEVDFPGLIELSAKPDDLGPLDGLIVFRNADAAAPPLRLEIPVRGGRFRGRGPVNAVVTIEKLILAGREATPFEQSYALSTRWLQVSATLATPKLLHVVDASSGIELTGVTLRGAVHDESAAAPTPLPWNDDSGSWAGPFRLVRTRRSARPVSGFDSPLEFVKSGWEQTRGRFYVGSDDPSFLIAHVNEYGDDGCDVVEDERSFTLRLRRAASLRVTVAPWPPPGADAGSPQARGVVTIARLLDPPVAQEQQAPGASRGPNPTQVSARVEALAREVLARCRRRDLAAGSPQRHVAAIDDHGVATFDDLCQGTWLAWAESQSDGQEQRDYVRIQRLTNGGRTPVDVVELVIGAGGKSELTLSSLEPEPVKATLAVHVVDAADGTPIELKLNEIAVYDLEDPVMETRPRFVGAVVTRIPRRAAVAAGASSPPADESSFDVHPGVAVVTIIPRIHVDYEPVTRWVEVAAGENEIVVPLVRSAGVLVDVRAERSFAAKVLEGTMIPLVRLVRNGVDSLPIVLTEEGNSNSFRQRYRFGPLDPGSYTLIVPKGSGFEHAGEFAVEVRSQEVTKIELVADGKDLDEKDPSPDAGDR